MNVIKRLVFNFFSVVNFINFYLKGVKCLTALKNIKGIVRVRGKGRILIGPGVKFNSGIYFNPIGGDGHLSIVCYQDAEIIIGDESGLSNCCLVSKSKIVIGKRVLIGGSVKIYDTDFHSLNSSHWNDRYLDSLHTKSQPVYIEDNVFIGGHSIILKGVTIGHNSIVGAGSVVTKNIPEFQLWGGNPARFIKVIRK